VRWWYRYAALQTDDVRQQVTLAQATGSRTAQRLDFDMTWLLVQERVTVAEQYLSGIKGCTVVPIFKIRP
jgi:hypothetical protein